MISIQSNQIVTITGIRGSGKSYFLDKLIKTNNRFLVYDVMHEHKIDDAIIINNLRDLQFHLHKGHKRIVYRPPELNEENFDWICEAVYRTGNRTFFVEESNRVMPNMQISKSASQLIDLGRHRNVGMVCVTRRIALLDKLPVSQSEHLIIFKTVLPNDIKYLKEFIGNVAEEAQVLRDHKFLYYSDGKTVLHAPV